MSKTTSGYEMLLGVARRVSASLKNALARSARLWNLALLGCLTAAAVLAHGCASGIGAPKSLAPLLYEGGPAAIAGRYIVVFRERNAGTASAPRRRVAVRDPVAAAQSRAAQALVRELGGEVRHVYTSALTGFSARLTPAALEALRRAPGVAWIQAEQRGTIATEQFNPPKGLDRISERLLQLDDRFTYWQTGATVHAYVIDTGILGSHSEFADFGGRATGGASFVSDPVALTDCQGHGTHVAGIIGGTTFGVAKRVQLHPVRVGLCSPFLNDADVIAGINWVTANAADPAVANISLQFSPNAAMNAAVAGSVGTGITYTIAAGNFNADACNTSPGSEPAAITVGSTNPDDDMRAPDSNFGTCLDLFAPGVGILSAGIPGNSDTDIKSGTSMAAPHVAGVAAFVLQDDPTATPALVLARIHAAADVTTDSTYVWPGIPNRGAGSPNELLHWGSGGTHDGYTDGDPHLSTVEGLHYDFQAAGEFVLLRDRGGMEIQVRQSPISTSFRPGPDGYHGLTTCVSLNTAVAARVAGHRVSWQPNISGVPDPSGLELRVDGVLTTLTASGVNVGSAVVRRSGANGMQIEFPNGTILVVTPGWWSSQSAWFLNVGVLNTRATEGIIGVRPSGAWLPALPDGTSLNGMPVSLHDRYVALYQRFGEAWRVTNRTSLFDYRRGTSTATFTARDWPTEAGQCAAPRMPSQPARPVPLPRPAEPRLAQEACRGVEDRNGRANCVFDVTATGETEFARIYQLSERIRAGLLRDRDREGGSNLATQQRPPPRRR